MFSVKGNCILCGKEVDESNYELAYPNNPEVEEYLCEECYVDLMSQAYPEYYFEEF